VIAEPDLVRRDGVVLVDDRYRAELLEGRDDVARGQEAAAVGDVLVGEQDLADGELVRGKRALPRLHEVALTDGGDGLELGQLARPLGEAEDAAAERDRPRRHDDERLRQRRHLFGDLGQGLLWAVIDEAAADLDDDTAGGGQASARHY